MAEKIKAFCSWSGGKESALSLYMAQQSGFEVTNLLTMANEEGTHSHTHEFDSSVLKAQSEALHVPLVQRKASWQTYEEEFMKAVSDIRDKGVGAGIFGDIDLIEHRQWVERVCSALGVTAVLPLWLMDRKELLRKFINFGFKAIVIAIDSRFMGEEWLGRELTTALIGDLKTLTNVDLCGEKGEYHTFVYDGPIFQKPVEFRTAGKVLRESHRLLGLECPETFRSERSPGKVGL
ncbi:MAG: ATP-binding region [Syntrophorhabdus sp. PtaU1.Bin002]|nr:MAG: ATP-binding region [Syntrophorhabdus sp. PtaU1.Bin002]